MSRAIVLGASLFCVILAALFFFLGSSLPPSFLFVFVAGIASSSLLYIFFGWMKPIYQMVSLIKGCQAGMEGLHAQLMTGFPKQKDSPIAQIAMTMRGLFHLVDELRGDLTREKNEKEAILESLGEGVVAVDENFIVTYVNFVGSKILDVPKRLLLGQKFVSDKNRQHELVFQKCMDLLQQCQKHHTILTDSIELGLNKKNYFDIVAVPKWHNTGAILVLQDKSSQHKILEMGKEFVANASHELKTPITIIKGFAETLQEIKDIPPDMLSEIIEKIVRNSHRMEKLVKNLLTLADLENVCISPFQHCDILPLLENCAQDVQAIYQDVHVDIEKQEDPISAAADASILELAIMNLLDNAAKYSKPPVKISIKAFTEAEEVVLHISDNGIGIPPQDVEHIFEKFYTVNKAHSRRLGGAGLGLSLVKTIIDKHQGTLQVHSTLGVGTMFTIRLPLAAKEC